MTDEVIPFGKYRGQPLEAMAQDRQYVDWLTAQPWFREKYESIYTIVINNFQEPSETPEHNALQVLFLDHLYTRKILELLLQDKRKKLMADNPKVQNPTIKLEFKQEFEKIVRWSDERRSGTLGPYDVFVQWILRLYDGDEWVDYIAAWYQSVSGNYSRVRYSDPNNERPVKIELKPTVGDDYPAVLRQMNAQLANVLFLERYTGVGATEEQFVKTFEMSDIRVLFRREVDALLHSKSPNP